MPFTTNKGYSVQAAGSNSGTWGAGNAGNDLNTGVFAILDNNMGGVVSKSLSSTNVTLTSTEAQNLVVRLTGSLLGNITITTPGIGFYLIDNQCSGAFTVTIQYTGAVGGTVIAQQTVVTLVVIDGTNGVRAEGQYPSLVALNALTATSGIPKKTGVSTWSLNTGVTDLVATTANRLFGTDGSGNSGLITTSAALSVAAGSLGIVGATKAEMEALSSTPPVIPSIQQYHPGHPKAWVTFNGTGTPAISQDYGVTSVVDTGVGLFTITFDTAFSDATYGWSGGANFPLNGSSGTFMTETSKTTTTLAIGIVSAGAVADLTRTSVVTLGDQ